MEDWFRNPFNLNLGIWGFENWNIWILEHLNLNLQSLKKTGHCVIGFTWPYYWYNWRIHRKFIRVGEEETYFSVVTNSRKIDFKCETSLNTWRTTVRFVNSSNLEPRLLELSNHSKSCLLKAKGVIFRRMDDEVSTKLFSFSLLLPKARSDSPVSNHFTSTE